MTMWSRGWCDDEDDTADDHNNDDDIYYDDEEDDDVDDDDDFPKRMLLGRAGFLSLTKSSFPKVLLLEARKIHHPLVGDAHAVRAVIHPSNQKDGHLCCDYAVQVQNH